jgi:hypothetical protein
MPPHSRRRWLAALYAAMALVAIFTTQSAPTGSDEIESLAFGSTDPAPGDPSVERFAARADSEPLPSVPEVGEEPSEAAPILLTDVPETVSLPVATVSGLAVEGQRIFTPTAEIALAGDGSWSTDVAVVEGENVITFEALDTEGRISARAVVIDYVPSGVPLPDVAFTAEQTFLASQEPEPWVFFSGTATPLTTVTISSDYGTATADTDIKGEWRTAVFFSAPGSIDPFPVTVTADNGSAEFDFTYTAP